MEIVTQHPFSLDEWFHAGPEMSLGEDCPVYITEVFTITGPSNDNPDHYLIKIGIHSNSKNSKDEIIFHALFYQPIEVHVSKHESITVSEVYECLCRVYDSYEHVFRVNTEGTNLAGNPIPKPMLDQELTKKIELGIHKWNTTKRINNQ